MNHDFLYVSNTILIVQYPYCLSYSSTPYAIQSEAIDVGAMEAGNLHPSVGTVIVNI